MSVHTPTPGFDVAAAESTPADSARRPLLGVLLWLAGGIVLCSALGVAAVSRTQEARVLEVAREMLGSETHNWLIPRVNGHIRLQKPPLAYWLTALSYQALDVSEGVGRIPAAVAGILTVGATALLASWLFGRRAGFFAGAALLGSYQFFRHSRLAETDVFVALFVTTAVFALWRGYGRGRGDEPSFARSALWFHGGAAAIALAAMAKGPPAAYPLLFFVAMAAFDGRWKMLGRFVACGAPLTAAVIGLPWFLYARQDPDYRQLVGDLKNSARGGRGHSSLFITYIPPLFVATAPWSVLWLVGLIGAIRQWKLDPRLRGVVVWLASMLIPLSLWGNKQFHYLMPVMPPLMILVGWLLDESLKAASGKVGDWGRGLWAATVIVFALAVPAPVVVGKMDRGHVITADYLVAAFFATAIVVVWLSFRSRGWGGAMKAFAAANVLVIFVLVGLWAPTLNPVDCRTITRELNTRYPGRPFVFSGKEDLPLVFHMRRVIPTARSDAALAAFAAQHPDAVAIEPISGTNRARPMIIEEVRFKEDSATYRVGRIDPAAAATRPSTAPAEDNAGE
jgi:4-amino-4-deoxy-L-arabinose transferase-like glycosyltransferase